MRDELIAVTGATGGVGSRVARGLAAAGARQRLIVSDPDRAPPLSGAQVALVTSYSDGEAMRDALELVTSLFLVSGREAVDRVAQHRMAVGAAGAVGVERIVYLSFLGAGPDSTFTFARDHFHTEQAIRSGGMDFTFLRDSLYAEVVPRLVVGEGVIRGPAGEGRVAWVARDDVADVACAVLTSDGHSGRSYDVTGPEALTMAESAAILSRFVGRPIVYRQESLEEARASRASYGAPAWQVEGWVTSYAAIATGELDVVADTVVKLTGHPPQTLEEFLTRTPESYQRLRA